MKNLFFTLILSGLLFSISTVGVSSITDDGNGNATITLDYIFEEDIYGFQIDILTEGVFTIVSTYGGIVNNQGFIVTNNEQTIIGYSIFNDFLPEGSGTFLNLSGTYNTANLGEFITISAIEDCTNGLPTCSYDEGDTRMILSNINAEMAESAFISATWEVGSGLSENNCPSGIYDCAGVCDGNAFIDDCGECVVISECDELSNDYSVPVSYRLFQSYPNPFNPTTTIKFSVPDYNKVLINIYDINGNIISTIVDGYFSKGTYSVVWDASDFTSGTYLAKIISNEFINTQKMILIK